MGTRKAQTMGTMRAALIHEPGGPEVLNLETLPIPTPKTGEVLIRVKAFGLNRYDLFTRLGYSPGLTFPRVLGIEAGDLLDEAPWGYVRQGEFVILTHGYMLRIF